MWRSSRCNNNNKNNNKNNKKWVAMISAALLLVVGIVESRPISLSQQGWKIQYGGPEKEEVSKNESFNMQDGDINNDERSLASEEVVLQPLRILFDTSELEIDTWSSKPQLREIIQDLKDKIIPDIQELLQSTLQVIQRAPNIINTNVQDKNGGSDGIEKLWKFPLPPDICYDLLKNVDFSEESGFVIDLEQHDMVMFIMGNSSNDPVLKCEDNTYAMSAPCMVFTPTNRPIVGFVSLCLDTLTMDWGNQNTNAKRLEHTLLHEITHNLGFNSEMYKYFRDSTTGDPLVPTPFTNIEEATCVNDLPQTDVSLPTTVLEPIYKTTSTGNDKLKSFQMNTPTVEQIIKTQFNCPSATGAFLENQPTNPADCFGSHWDERYYLYNSMSSIYDQESYFTPLTLALMEDSGWYRADYSHPQVKVSPFGLNAGCQFLQQPCLSPTSADVPEYSKGFFCNEYYSKQRTADKWQCDANHSARGRCDLHPNIRPKISYIPDDPRAGPLYTRADYCPLVRMDLTDCRDPSNAQYSTSSKKEVFGPSSNCIEVQRQTSSSAICVETTCNSSKRTVDITVFGSTNPVSCEYDFQQISISQHGFYTSLTCPRISAICPQMMTCPGQCSGKGTCDTKTLKCNCFDKSDSTEGCYNSKPLQYTKSISASWNKLGKSSSAASSYLLLSAALSSTIILFSSFLSCVVLLL